ncbi:MAG: DUF5702 domain-containing protein [Lachnospiraceae bacterium]|nr:DUF5702 domain-containing protein [Lachnospiraceae bacterium]
MLKSKYDGAITVFSSLLFLMIFTLIAVSLESAHQTGVRVGACFALNAGLDSLFSNYDADLYEDYGVLFLNEGMLESDADDLISEYMRYGAGVSFAGDTFTRFDVDNVSTAENYYATDDNGIFFRREVLELMKVNEVTNLLNTIKTYVEQAANGQAAAQYIEECKDDYENVDWEEKAKELGIDFGGEEEAQEETPDIDAKVDESLSDSIITQATNLLAGASLALYIRDQSDVSPAAKNLTVEFTKDHDIEENVGFIRTEAEELLFDEYVLDNFNSYTNEKDGSGIKYEAEYVIGGAQSDKQNLAIVLNEIMGIRMGLNIAYLLAHTDCLSQATATATALVGWTGIPVLIQVVMVLLIGAWAFCEAVLDVRALIAGDKVAFVKSRATWTTTLAGCVGDVLNFKKATPSKYGVDYKMYLRILLFLNQTDAKTLRTMQIIEWNMRSKDATFTLSKCIYAVEVTATITVEPVFSSILEGFGRSGDYGGYSYRIRGSNIY